MNENYYGVFDYKESDTFRPTKEKRIHKNYPYSKTLTCRSDSCCVILNSSGGGNDLMEEKQELRIRKLTGKECYRLMGFTDEDCDRAREVISEAMVYHTAGDSIVVNVLMAIIGQMIE